MSEANKQIVRDFFTAMGSRRVDDIRVLLHSDHLFHLPIVEKPLDRDTHMQMNMALQESLCDFDRHFHDQIAESGNLVRRMQQRRKHIGDV